MPTAPLQSDDHFPPWGAGEAHPDQPSFSMFGLVEKAGASASAQAVQKGLGFRCFLADDVPEFLSGDAGCLRQVLASLLDNAVKFTGNGEVRLDVRVESTPEETGENGLLLRFTIIDTGAGIQPEACAGIFDKGPALAICRRNVRRLGGEIHVHSTPGEGATFWFTARFALAVAGNHPPVSIQATAVALPGRALRILIAEDNPVNQFVLGEQLKRLGHTSVAVSNGREALARIKDSAWDVILLDCQMPVMDGFETVAAMRSAEAGGGRRTWAVAVTANGFDGQREACLRAGMDDFLSKPFNVRQLTAVLARIPVADNEGLPVDAARLEVLAGSTTGDGENLLERMARLFTESGAEILDQIDQALREDDLEAVLRAAHKLGGGCGYFGAAPLRTLCGEIERLGREGDETAVRSLAALVRQEYARVELALRGK